MVIGAIVCLVLAILVGGSGLWTLRRPAGPDVTSQVIRLVAPTQLAAAIMLAAAGVLALAAPARLGMIGLICGIVGAVATVAAGSWQGARYAARRQAAAPGCGSGGGCGGCSQICER
ncbi:MAG: hypothetical protein KDB71_02990 [Mycobacterium sp.]|nr:hypothetical protein [Mycobacterium sp.]